MIYSVILFAAACLGHVALCVYSHNWWYAQVLPEGVGKVIRLGHALAIVAFPPLLWWFMGLDLLRGMEAAGQGTGQTLLTLYLGVCLVVGLAVFPVITILRLLRRQPALLVGNQARTLHIDKELGYRPVGASTHGFLARLPGNEIFQVDFTEKTLELPRLPAAWDGLTILHLSDLHFIGTPDRFFYQRVMDECVAWDPDLIAFTGDLVDSAFHRRWIVPILAAALKCRIASFAILGNHDIWWEPPAIRRRISRGGAAHARQQLGAARGPRRTAGGDRARRARGFAPSRICQACPEAPFRLCLSHTPDNIRWARLARHRSHALRPRPRRPDPVPRDRLGVRAQHL